MQYGGEGGGGGGGGGGADFSSRAKIGGGEDLVNHFPLALSEPGRLWTSVPW